MGDAEALGVAFVLLKAPVNTRFFEAFSGGSGNPNVMAGWGSAAEDRGMDVRRNEIIFPGNTEESWTDHDLGYMPDLPGNIMNITAEDIVEAFGGHTPDMMAFSSPCEGFSIAGSVEENWGDWDKEKKAAFNRAWREAERTGDFTFFDDPTVGPKATSDRSRRGRELMNQVLGLIEDTQTIRDEIGGKEAENPVYYIMENPTGMMRYQTEMPKMRLVQPPMEQDPRYPIVGGRVQPSMRHVLGTRSRAATPPPPSVTHASYSGPMAEALGMERFDLPGHSGLPGRKPTDLWSNLDTFVPRPHTAVGAMDDPRPGRAGHGGVFHEAAPRGSKTGIQGLTDLTIPETGVVIPKYHVRSLIPYGLGRDVAVALERKLRGDRPPGRLF